MSNGFYFSTPSLFLSELKNRVNSDFPNCIHQRYFVPFFEEGRMWKVEGRIQFKVFPPSPFHRNPGPSGRLDLNSCAKQKSNPSWNE
jgi:hypothetical protein